MQLPYNRLKQNVVPETTFIFCLPRPLTAYRGMYGPMVSEFRFRRVLAEIE